MIIYGPFSDAFIETDSFLPRMPRIRLVSMLNRLFFHFETYAEQYEKMDENGLLFSHWAATYFEGDIDTIKSAYANDGEWVLIFGEKAFPKIDAAYFCHTAISYLLVWIS